MAVGLPLKTTYANGDVFSASDVNDTNGTINAYLAPSLGYSAGKNKIINGDFGINQRAFTSTTTTATYGFDRFNSAFTDGTSTYSAQTFTVGTAPVAGYESTNYARLVSTGQTLNTAFTSISQKIESVRTFAGQTITISFWAKASTGTPSVAASAWQEFGTGGSATVQSGSKVAITSSWARYSVTLTLASIAGKTVAGGNDNLRIFLITSAGSTRDAYTGTLGIQSVTIDFWGLQVEPGSTMTSFQTATGTIQGELAACQRYYWRGGATNGITASAYALHGFGKILSTSAGAGYVALPVTMRVAATSMDFSSLSIQDNINLGTAISSLTLSTNDTSLQTGAFSFSLTGTAGRTGTIQNNNSTSGYIGFSAEL
jgi:hypothetical protein